MKFAIYLFVCAVCIAVLNGVVPSLFGQDKQLPTWVLDPVILDQLDEVEEACGYYLRPPKGYTRNSPENAPKAIEIVNWLGPRRDDGSAATFQIAVIHAPEGKPVPTFEKASEIIIDAAKGRYENYSMKQTETGQVNGVKFIRTEWTGIDREFKIAKHGIEFVNMDGAKLVHLSVQDIEHSFEESSKLGLASALTFSKKK